MKKICIGVLLITIFLIGCKAIGTQEISAESENAADLDLIYEDGVGPGLEGDFIEYDIFNYPWDLPVCLPTEESALAVAEAICKAVYPDIDYSLYEANIGFLEDDDVWLVDYSLIYKEPGGITLGGGGPYIYPPE